MPRLKLAVLTTHPIQYYAPVFRCLADMEGLDVRVFFTWSQASEGKIFDTGFGKSLQWDIPLLEGYNYEFLPNVAGRPGTEHFRGISNPTLLAAIKSWNPDLLLVYGWNNRSHLRAMLHFHRRLPVLFRGDSTLLDPTPRWRKVLRRHFLQWVYRHVDMAIAVGANNHDYFRWCGLSENCIAFAPHSVDTIRFTEPAVSHEREAATWRARLGIDASVVVILFAGKLQPKKNPGLLLEAFNLLDVPAHLVFCGDGELEAALRLRAAHIDRVHFIPFQNQRAMPIVYRIGDVLALPSSGPGETWGLALNEAMASGRAVIASSRVGGARDLIREGVNGWIFESGNLPALLQVLRVAVNRGPLELKLMGQAGRTLSKQWSTEESARQIAEAAVRCHRRFVERRGGSQR